MEELPLPSQSKDQKIINAVLVNSVSTKYLSVFAVANKTILNWTIRKINFFKIE